MVKTTPLGCLALGGLVRLSHPTQRPVGWDKRTIRHIVGQTRNALPTLWLPKAQVAPAHQNTGPIPNAVHPMDTGWVRCTASRMETVFWWAGARFSVARRMMVKTTRLGCLALGGLVRLSHPTQRPVGWDKRTIRHIVGQTRNALPTLLAAQSTGRAGPPEYGPHPEYRASNGYGLGQMHRSRMETVFWWAGASVFRCSTDDGENHASGLSRARRSGSLVPPYATPGRVGQADHQTHRWSDEKRFTNFVAAQSTGSAGPPEYGPHPEYRASNGYGLGQMHRLSDGNRVLVGRRRFSVARRMMVKTTPLGCLALGGLVRLSHPTQRPVGWDKRTIRHIVGQTRNALPTLWRPKARVAPAHQNTGPIPNAVHPMDTGWVRCTASRMETVFWWAGARFSVARRMMVKTTRLWVVSRSAVWFACPTLRNAR